MWAKEGKPWEFRSPQQEAIMQMKAPEAEFAYRVRDIKRKMEHAETVAKIILNHIRLGVEKHGITWGLDFATDDALMIGLIRKEAVHPAFEDWVLETIRATFARDVQREVLT